MEADECAPDDPPYSRKERENNNSVKKNVEVELLQISSGMIME